MGPLIKSPRRLSRATALFLFFAANTACFAEVEGVGPGPTTSETTGGETSDAGEATTSVGTQAGSGSGAGSETTGGAGPTSSSTADDSTQASTGDPGEGETEDESTSGSTSSTETDTEAGTGAETETDVVWEASCQLPLDAPPCSKATLGSIPVFCAMPAFQADGGAFCGRSNWSRVSIDLPVGEFVIGSTNFPDAELSVVDTRSALLMCGGVFDTLPISVPTSVAIDLRSETTGGVSGLVVRSRTSLCPISAAGCCEGSNASAESQCEDAGLRACVESIDAFCTDMWDPLCVAEATLLCGADCLGD